MSPREARIASELVIREFRPEECVEAFRTVRVGTLDDPALSDSFRSHYEEGMDPRYQQTQHAALHMAVSLWRTEARARGVARRFYPDHGEYLARCAFVFGDGLNCLEQEYERDPLHLTIWGNPETLASRVIEITPVY